MTSGIDPAAPIRLTYRLTEADVRHYRSAGMTRRCWRSCRGRRAALLVLVGLGCFLVGTCFHAHGIRSGSLALGTALLVLAGLAWAREARSGRQFGRIARAMGLPRDLELVASPEGIAEVSDLGQAARPRTFAWSEVVAVERVDHLTIVHLRPAGAVLIVPDSAFPAPEDRQTFQAALRSWHHPAQPALTGPATPGGPRA